MRSLGTGNLRVKWLTPEGETKESGGSGGSGSRRPSSSPFCWPGPRTDDARSPGEIKSGPRAGVAEAPFMSAPLPGPPGDASHVRQRAPEIRAVHPVGEQSSQPHGGRGKEHKAHAAERLPSRHNFQA